MKLGLFGINFGPCVDPACATRVARAAEAAGFDSLWTAEHVVLPDPQTPDSPIPAQTPLLHPAVALAHVAAQTETIKLATGIVIVPQRNPVVLAKEFASVDVVSGGRLILGAGTGYLRSEFDALGMSFDDRGGRMNEAIEVIRTLWTEEKPAYHGDFFDFGGIDAQPRPLQRPHPPIVIGGLSAPALRRAVRQGNGWYGFALDHAAAAASIAGLREAAKAVERPASLGGLELTITPAGALDEDSVARYAELGVERLVVIGAGGSADELVAFVEQNAETVLRAG
ncbi:MAG: LLM class F420-dependent oxidoreductase [Myxococcota bacterium]